MKNTDWVKWKLLSVNFMNSKISNFSKINNISHFRKQAVLC